MLDSIQITNFALIDSLQLDFDAGLSALTGETGAGKSILLDAIKLAAGDRADSDSIRAGCERAEISVRFDVGGDARVSGWLADNEMDSGGECLVRRVLYANGRSRAFINGYNATLQQLRALCDMLVDIHGQHEHQSLQKPLVQRQLLDDFIGEPQLLERVRVAYNEFSAMQKRLLETRSGAQEREQRIDLLGLYCEELDQLNLGEGEFETLQQEYRRLANAGKLLEKTGAIIGRLYEDEESSIESALSLCERELAELMENDNALAGSYEMINAALIQAREAGAELRDYRDGIELDGAGLQALNERIANAQNLARKHHVEVNVLPALGVEMRAELTQLRGADFDLEAIEAQRDQALERFRSAAEELSGKRRNTAQELSRQISDVMQQLGMQGGVFQIEVESGQAPTSHGVDAIRYLVSANTGQPPKSLARVASGGELSRISLAIQVIMSESSRIPTLIFDEVDSGVGGAVAEIVGRKLRLLGRDRQVLCVTHLAQVASQAHHHFLVEKDSASGATTTSVTRLDEGQRLDEIARMLGGVRITEQSRAHASEMIASRD